MTGLDPNGGQFGDREYSFVENALEAVLVGEEVPVKKTRYKG